MPVATTAAIGSIDIVPGGRAELELRPIQTPGIEQSPGLPQSDATPRVSFEDVFSRMVDGAASADRSADAQVAALANGASDDIHGTMISVKEAEISLKLVASVRNKLLDAFHELWRTSL
jgi:flagellar hook-basal body complex protein FliE